MKNLVTGYHLEIDEVGNYTRPTNEGLVKGYINQVQVNHLLLIHNVKTQW